MPMADRDRQAPDWNGSPRADGVRQGSRVPGASSGPWPTSPEVTGGARARDDRAAAPAPGWREPFVVVVLAVAGLGAAVVALGAAAAPASAALF